MIQAPYAPGPRIPRPGAAGEVLTYGARYGVPWLNVKQTLLNALSAFDRLSLTQTAPLGTRQPMNPALHQGGRYPPGPGGVYPPSSAVGYPRTLPQYYTGHPPTSRYIGDPDPYLDRYGARTPNPYGSYRSRTPGTEWGPDYPGHGRRTWSYDDRRPQPRGGMDEFGRPLPFGANNYAGRDGYYDPLNEDRHYGGSQAWHGKRYDGRDVPYDEYYENEQDGYLHRPGGSIHESTEYFSGPEHMRRRYSGGEQLYDRGNPRGRYPSSHIPPQRGVDGYIEDDAMYNDPHSAEWSRGHGHRGQHSSRRYEHGRRGASVDPLQQPAGYIGGPPEGTEFPDEIVPIHSRPGSEYSAHSRSGSTRGGYATASGRPYVPGTSASRDRHGVPLAPRGGARFGSRAQSPFTPSRHREYREGDEEYLDDSDEEDIEPGI